MPRGRPRKRLMRMDAAVDAMTPYGFSKEKIIKNLKELLKEYGGDDGWPFIEDSSYTVLLEALLRDVQKDDHEQVAQDGNRIMNNPSDDAENSIIESDAQLDERHQENAPADIVAAAEPTSLALAAADGTCWKDILPDQTNGQTSMPATDSQRHRHCYGWIVIDGDDEDDFMFSAPASGGLGPPGISPRV